MYARLYILNPIMSVNFPLDSYTPFLRFFYSILGYVNTIDKLLDSTPFSGGFGLKVINARTARTE